MRRFFAITAIGKDRPGIVAGVSKALYDLGTNIEDSSMTILSGEFAMIPRARSRLRPAADIPKEGTGSGDRPG